MPVGESSTNRRIRSGLWAETLSAAVPARDSATTVDLSLTTSEINFSTKESMSSIL